jgi:two-component system chemotaxis response regulator CheY
LNAGAVAAASPFETLSKAGDDMSKPRVLVCDDSILMRRLVGDCLTSAGWEVAAEAGDGQQAIDKYQVIRPDAVTMDIVMPGTDGLTALTQILALDPEAKVVVISALNQTRLISEAIRKGAQDFIAKPFLPEQLQQTLAACLPESTLA